MEIRYLIIPASFLLSIDKITQIIIPLLANFICLLLLILHIILNKVKSVFITICIFV